MNTIDMDDPQDSDLETAANAWLLSNMAHSGIPLDKWTLVLEDPGKLTSIDQEQPCTVTPPMTMRFARLLIKYLESSLGISATTSSHADSVILSGYTGSTTDIDRNLNLARWYIAWHASTSLIDQTIRDLVVALLDLYGNSQSIFRGEPREYQEVSSTIYRLYGVDDAALIEKSVRSLLRIARQYEKIDNDLELQAVVQHLGGKTNLIDFSSSVWIALYFACSKEHEYDGRILELDTSTSRKDIHIFSESTIPKIERRIQAQQSVLVSPKTGLLKPNILKSVTRIVSQQKRPLMIYLREVHRIRIESIYPDIHGFIREQEAYLSYEILLEAGNTLMRRGRPEEALRYFNKAQIIDQDPFFIGQAKSSKALALMKLARNNEALVSADSAISILDSRKSTSLGNAHLVKAIVFWEQGRTIEAYAEVLEAISNFEEGSCEREVVEKFRIRCLTEMKM